VFLLTAIHSSRECWGGTKNFYEAGLRAEDVPVLAVCRNELRGGTPFRTFGFMLANSYLSVSYGTFLVILSTGTGGHWGTTNKVLVFSRIECPDRINIQDLWQFACTLTRQRRVPVKCVPGGTELI